MHAIEHFHDSSDLDVETGFFLDLPARGVDQRFAKFNAPAGNRPLPVARLVRALDDQRPSTLHDDTPDADHRTIRKLARHYSPITLMTTRLRRWPSNSA